MAMGLSLLLRKPQIAELGHLSRDQACPGLAWSGMGADDWPVGLCICMTPPLVAQDERDSGKLSETPARLTFNVGLFSEVDIKKQTNKNLTNSGL